MDAWQYFLIGLAVGGSMGYVTFALMTVASKADDDFGES